MIVCAALVAACSSPAPRAAAPIAPSPPVAVAAVAADPDPGWPRARTDEHGWRVIAHQPTIERLVGEDFAARVAVSVDAPASPRAYAVVRLRARASIDKRLRLVALDDVVVAPAAWAAPPARADDADAALARDLPPLVATIALDRIVAELATDRARVADRALALANDPPRIVVAPSPAVLVPVDGDAVWRRAGPHFDRAVNTRALLMRDRARRWLYVYIGDTWYRARTLAGPWRTAALIPAGLEPLRAALVGRDLVDLLDAPGSPLLRALAVGRVPRIFVATAPAELIALAGPPALGAIADTKLSFVENADADLLFDGSDKRWYALLSGRWFAARALAGPWQFVAPDALPRDFSRIPPEHPAARVLASVPGTELAAEALVVGELPETATVRRDGPSLRVRYDGPPAFAPLDGTLLRWAVNSATPVVEAAAPLGGEGVYYALADGVWFTAPSPDGPWRVANAAPAGVDDIPPSAPLHFIRYVRVLGAGDGVVRVGYTPGYFGACLAEDGVVVFGTGYRYAPYVGSVFIGRPATYGFAARFAPGLGWTLGGNAGSARVTFRPWWQPAASAVAGADAPPFADELADLYARWGDAIAPSRARDGRGVPGIEVPRGGDDLYAGSDGRVYRARGDAWERWDAGGWRPASTLQASAGGVAADALGVLSRERQARVRGQARWDLFRETAAAQ